jgi:hypothetical protein
VITVDGEPVTGSESDDPEDIMRRARTELKCCKALAAMNPPHDVSASLHARIVELLRTLRRHGTQDQDVAQMADLSDEELRQATGIIRALRAALPEKGYQGGTGFRVALGGYALDVVDEIQTRTANAIDRRDGRNRDATESE